MKQSNERVYAYKIANIYKLLVEKAERKGRTKEEVDEITYWLTGYDQAGMEQAFAADMDLGTFYANTPKMNEHSDLITGMICGYRVEEIEDPIIKKMRQMDKLIDELAKGRKMEKILRQPKVEKK